MEMERERQGARIKKMGEERKAAVKERKKQRERAEERSEQQGEENFKETGENGGNVHVLQYERAGKRGNEHIKVVSVLSVWSMGAWGLYWSGCRWRWRLYLWRVFETIRGIVGSCRWRRQLYVTSVWNYWVWVYWCFTSHATIFQSYMWRHRCACGLKKKLYLRLGSQRHRHFVRFFNVPLLHRHGITLFIRWFRHTTQHVVKGD